MEPADSQLHLVEPEKEVDSSMLGSQIIAWNTTTHATQIKDVKLRAVVGLICCMSIIGSLLIIFSYICFKNRRTRAREILVHISLMDCGVALSNIIGLSVYFDQYYFAHPFDVADYIDNLCKIQAFFAGYTTLSSIFWTIALMTYLYFLILHTKTKLALYFLRFCYIFCYGLPLLISLWLVLTGRLGYSPYDSSGWCSLISKDPLRHGEVNVFVTVFGNDLWIYLAIFLIPTLYVSIRFFISSRVEASKKYTSAEKQFWSALYNVDYKFLFIPIIFVSLRIWSCIVNIMLFAGVEHNQVPDWINRSLLYLSGIGDSGQGFANAILFVIFSKNVRKSFEQCIRCKKDTDQLSSMPNGSGNKKGTNSLEAGESSKMLEPSASGSIFLESDELGDKDNEKSTHFHYDQYGSLN